jgi:hypothetical protein
VAFWPVKGLSPPAATESIKLPPPDKVCRRRKQLKKPAFFLALLPMVMNKPGLSPYNFCMLVNQNFTWNHALAAWLDEPGWPKIAYS